MKGLARNVITFLLFFVANCENVTENLFGPEANGWMMGAIADFNGDKATDLILVNENMNSVGVLMTDQFGYMQNTRMHRQNFVQVFSGQNIINVMPADINGDGNMDFYVIDGDQLLTYFCKCLDNTTVKIYKCSNKRGNQPNIACTLGTFQTEKGPATVKINSEFPPMIADFDNDWRPDILFRDDRGQVRLFMGDKIDPDSGSWKSTVSEKTKDIGKIIKGFKFDLDQNLAGFSSLYASFDSDLSADIMFEGNIYIDKGLEFEFSKSLPNVKDFDIGLPQILPIDNPSKTLDFLLPVCKGKVSLGPLSGCSSGGLKRLNFEELKWNDIKVNLPAGFSDFAWITGSSKNNLKSKIPPLTVRQGDVDLDGFVDLVAVIALKPIEKDFEQPTVALFKNKKCNETSRCFEISEITELKTSDDKIPIVSTFLDVTPAGRLGIVTTFVTSEGKTSINAVLINTDLDSAFLKLSISDDVKGYDEFTAVDMPGAMVACEIASREMRAALLPRLSATSLAMPYTIFGLGQLPPYVDKISVKLPSNNSEFFSHALIIPNSQLVLIPKPKYDPSAWQLQSFLLVSWYMFAVLITMAVLAVTSIIMVGGLHFRDKRIEQKEKEEEAQHFHFDGM